MADAITNAPEVQGAPVEPVEAQVASVAPNGSKSVKDIISAIMATGNAVRYKNCLVKSCRVEEEDNYTRVSITLGNEVTGFLPDASGNYLPAQVTTVFSSGFALSACLKNNEDISWLAGIINENPNAIRVLLPGRCHTHSHVGFCNSEVPVNCESILRLSYPLTCGLLQPSDWQSIVEMFRTSINDKPTPSCYFRKYI